MERRLSLTFCVFMQESTNGTIVPGEIHPDAFWRTLKCYLRVNEPQIVCRSLIRQDGSMMSNKLASSASSTFAFDTSIVSIRFFIGFFLFLKTVLAVILLNSKGTGATFEYQIETYHGCDGVD